MSINEFDEFAQEYGLEGGDLAEAFGKWVGATNSIKVPGDGITRRVFSMMQQEVKDLNKAKGWYEEDRSFGDECALLHSEVSELFEEWRMGGTTTRLRESDGKPEGPPSEMADILIRLLDTCERYNVDLAKEYRIKMEFNKTRPHRHGGKAV